MSEVKFTDEELNKLKDIQQSYVNMFPPEYLPTK
jgi:hypothetical protein